jgi:hypothetical protein
LIKLDMLVWDIVLLTIWTLIAILFILHSFWIIDIFVLINKILN